MDKNKIRIEKRTRRHKRIRSRIHGTAESLRLSVFRSNKFMYAELINDDERNTVASASSVESKAANKVEAAREVGKMLAAKALAKKIKKVVFDRGGYIYTGRVKALAEGAREGGLTF